MQTASAMYWYGGPGFVLVWSRQVGALDTPSRATHGCSSCRGFETLRQSCQLIGALSIGASGCLCMYYDSAVVSHGSCAVLAAFALHVRGHMGAEGFLHVTATSRSSRAYSNHQVMVRRGGFYASS
jgi:hypothetical protein